MASFQKRRSMGRAVCAAVLIAATLVGVAASPASAAPPSNDDFANAPFVAINGNQLPITATNVDATFEIGEPTPGCAFEGDSIQTSVWWRISVVTGGPLKITTQGSDFDTQLGIYTGTSLANIQEVGCDDDNEGTFQASRVIDAPNGTVFYVQVDGFGGGTGTITLDAEILPCQATWHVDSTATGANDGTSWANAFTELQDGLAAASGCQDNNALDQVLVAQGTYVPSEVSGDRRASFEIPPGVEVIGGHPIGGGAADPEAFPTILSGDLDFDDTVGGSNAENAHSVVVAPGGSSTASVLDGFTIQAGNADGPFPGERGAGVRIDAGSQLTIRNSSIRDNTAFNGGGVFHAGTDLVLRDAIVTNNAANGSGAGAFFFGGGSIVSSTIENNTGSQSVAAIDDLEVINSTVASFGAAALTISSNASATSVDITNSIFSADASRGVYVSTGSSAIDVSLTNSVITGSDEALRVDDFAGSHNVNVTNSILWGNSTSTVVNSVPGTSITAHHSIVEGSGGSASWALSKVTDGGGNLDADPQWVDPLNGNFRLRNLSPAVNAGSPTVTVIPLDFFDLDDDGATNTERTPDLDLTDRIKDGTVDMGPFERAPVPCQPIIFADGDAINGAQDGLTWTDAFTNLQDAIAQANACAGVAFQIWVAEGVYTPHASDRTVRFSLPHQVEIIGGFDGTENDLSDRPFPLRDVVLSGDLNFDDAPGAFPGSTTPGPDNSQGVVVVERDTVATLSDLAVSGGNADGANGGRADGGGIDIEAAAGAFGAGSLTIVDVTVRSNFAADDGGGILAGGDLFAFGGAISLNRADGDGGGLMSTGGFAELSDTALASNTAGRFGGGVRSSGAAALNLIGTDFSSNSSTNDGGAVYATSNTNIAGSTFKLNSSGSDGGAIYANSSSLSIVASEFVGNDASTLAGAILVSAPGSAISSSSFTSNSAGLAGGAILVDSQATTRLSISNSIFWDNSAPTGPEIVNDIDSFTSIRRSIVEGSGGSGAGWDPGLGFDLGGNIDGDPLFTNTNAFDLTPVPGSPAIGSGDAAVMNRDSFDRDRDGDNLELAPDFVGADRIQGDGPEIGSREVQDGVPGAVQALTEPCVVYDSTLATGGLAGPMDGGEIRAISVSGPLPSTQGGSNFCVPTDATAATLLIAADSPVREGNLRLSKAGTAPSGGVVNFAPNGLENANTVTVPLSASGQVDLGANGGPQGAGLPLTGVRLVVLAYHSPLASSEFVPVTPCAIADSRSNQGATGSFVGPFTDGATYPAVDALGTFPAGQGGGNTSCGVPTTADAVVVNVVAINPTGGTGRILIGADGTTPSEGTPFAPLGMNNAAVAVVPISGDGTLDVDIEAPIGASAHVRLVVLGYHQPAGDSLFVPVNPCAAFDTRSTQGSSGGFTGIRQGGQTTTYQLSGIINDDQGGATQNGSCGVPVNATGVLINLVAVNSVGEGNLQISGAGTSPTGGVLNFAALSPSMNNSNAVPVELSPSGQVDVFVNGGPNGNGLDRTHIRGVVLGYYIDPPPPPAN